MKIIVWIHKCTNAVGSILVDLPATRRWSCADGPSATYSGFQNLPSLLFWLSEHDKRMTTGFITSGISYANDMPI